jgi:hypothetical protein
MDTEDAFPAALTSVRAFRIACARPELIDEAGRAAPAFRAGTAASNLTDEGKRDEVDPRFIDDVKGPENP